MNLTNKLALETGVYCETREDSKTVVNYLKDCGVNNKHTLSGTDGDIRMRKENFTTILTFEEFESLISEPTEPVVINNYNIY